jgi:uncharacterized protein
LHRLSRLFAPLLLALSAITAAAPATAAVAANDGLAAIPQLTAHVTDTTNTLTPQQKSALEQMLAGFEQSKGSQIAVLMIPSTKPEEIEQYSIRVAEAWKIGRKGTDDGLILLVAKDDHHVRIEVGYGLEGVIPDVIAKRIIREVMAPHFVNGDFYTGISDGLQTAIGLINGETLPPPPPQQRASSHRSGRNWDNLLTIGFILVFVVGGVLVRVLGRVLGSMAVGLLVAVVAFFALGVLAAVFGGIIAFVVALLAGSGLGGFGGFGGFGGGGFGGGGGGGFSGGGGGFGGGGASGSW